MDNSTIIASIITAVATIAGVVLAYLLKADKIIVTNSSRWKKKLKKDLVILINGGSGVGKTTVAWALARKFNIVSVIGSDVLRECARYYEEKLGSDKNDPIFKSSFDVIGQEKIPDEDLLIKMFKEQCKDLTPPLIRTINRIRRKRDPSIIEGVNIIASEVFESIPIDHQSKIIFINLHLDDEKLHIKRLRQRGESSNESPEETDRYIKNIKNIRIIDQFLNKDTVKHKNDDSCIIIIENSKNVSDAVDAIEKKIKKNIKGWL